MEDKINKRSPDGFLRNLGLSQDESLVYQELLKLNAPVSTLLISQKTNIPRTNVYRIIEQLKEIGLVEQIVAEKKSLVKPSDLSRLELLVSDKKQKALDLEATLPIIKKTIAVSKTPITNKTQVAYFNGKNGIKQLLWNSLKAKQIFSYSFLAYEDSTDKKFAKKYREERWLKKIKIKDLLSDNDKYFTEKNLKLLKTLPIFKHYQSRYLPAKKINIDHDFIIYADVTAFYSWHKNEIFGVEIHNANVSHLQKQIFELLWSLAKTPEEVFRKKEI